MTAPSEAWRQVVARVLQLIRLPLNPHDPPRIPPSTIWAIDQTWRAIESGERLSREAYIKLGNIAVGLGKHELAQMAYAHATKSEQAGSDELRLRAVANQNSAMVYLFVQNHAEGLRASQTAVENWNELSQAADAAHELTEALLLQATFEKRLGNTSEAHEILTQALVLSRTRELTVLEARCWVQFAHLDYADAELHAANEKIKKALDLLALGGHHQELVRTYYNAALLSAESGDIALAVTQLERARELMETHHIEYGNGKVEALLSELRLQLDTSST